MKSACPLLPLAAVLLALHGWAAPAARADAPGGTAASPWAALARGRVEPRGGVIQIAANRDGIVREVRVNEGDRVAPGAVLATLDDEAARLRLALAQRQQAQARLALEPLRIRQAAAAREVRRLEQLVAEQLANAQDLDEARDRVAEVGAEISQGGAAEETARAELALAQFEVDARVVRAPVAGQIIRRLASPGEGTGSGTVTPLFWLAPDGPQVVRAQLDEDSVHLVTPGQSAEVVAESAAGPVTRARVQRVGLYFGPRPSATDDPAERQDVRVVDCVLELDAAAPPLLIGQRVLVRFLRPGESAR
jgi:HlyD family secretion protein